MAQSTLGSRLRQARLAAGFATSKEAADALGMKPSTYSSHERAGMPGARNYDPTDAARYARKFRVDDSWLLTGKGRGPIGHAQEPDHIPSEQILADDVPLPQSKVRVVGYVGAGTEAIHLYSTADEFFEEIDRPIYAGDTTVAVEIRGESLGPLVQNWLVYYDDVKSPVTPDLFGRMCVVGLSDDRILVKTIQRTKDGTFRLLSNNPKVPTIEGAQIEWAAKVVGLGPRS